MADASPLTPAEHFIVKRICHKVGAAKHHIVDAANAAIVLPPEVLVRCGVREAIAVLEKELGYLRAYLARATTPEETSG